MIQFNSQLPQKEPFFLRSENGDREKQTNRKSHSVYLYIKTKRSKLKSCRGVSPCLVLEAHDELNFSRCTADNLHDAYIDELNK